jgi:hypothetical protein
MKALGIYPLLNMLDAASEYGQAHFTDVLGWSATEYEVLSGKVRTQLRDRTLQLYQICMYSGPSFRPMGRQAAMHPC